MVVCQLCGYEKIQPGTEFCPVCGSALSTSGEPSDSGFAPDGRSSLAQKASRISFPTWLGLGLGLIGFGLVVGALLWRWGGDLDRPANLLAEHTDSPITSIPSTVEPPALAPDLPSPTPGIHPESFPGSLTPTATMGQLPTRPIGSYAGWIAYTLGFEAEREIYLLELTTGQKRQVTSNSFQDESPSFSPDGSQIAYSSYRPPAGWDIFVYDFQTQTERQVTDFVGQARFPVWSPVLGDGRILFVGRQGEPDFLLSNIWIVESDGSGLAQLTTANADYIPAWAPDGKQVIFGRGLRDDTGDGRVTTSDNLDLFILDLSSGELRNLTSTPYYDDFYAHWSPDGQWIVSCSVRQDSNGDGVRNLDDSRGLYLIHPDGSDQRYIDLGNQLTFDPSWSPDGQWILYGVKIENGIFEIWVHNPFTQETRRLTSAGPYLQPTWGQ